MRCASLSFSCVQVKDTELIGGLTVEKALVGIAKDNSYVICCAIQMDS